MLLLKLADNFTAFTIWINAGIYKIAAYAFEVFILLSNGQIVDSSSYEKLINNFYVVLGIILLFFLAFSLLKGMVNPEDQKQGTTVIKNIIINLVTSVAILAILPTIFGFLYDFQTSFITRYNVIGKFFGYGSTSTTGNIDGSTRNFVEHGAYQIVNGVFTAFMNVNMDKCNSTTVEECQDEVKSREGVFRTQGDYSFANAMADVESTGDFALYDEFSANITEGEVEFQWFLSLIAALILVYVAVSFCFDMGLRMVKLIFYQAIAPIPIFARVIPEGPLKGSFDKWVKAVLTCYFEVYVRIFVFYFAIWLCLTLMNSTFLTSEISEFPLLIRLLTKAFLLMGIILFMKQAPKFISDVTGLDSGNMKLGIGSKLKEAISAVPGSAAMGALAMKTVSGIDAKRNGLNFKDGWNRIEGKGPIANLQKSFRSMLPYSAQSAESRRKSDEQKKEIESRIKIGQEAFAKYGSADDYVAGLEGEKFKSFKLLRKSRGDSKSAMLAAKAEFEAAQAGSFDTSKYSNQTEALQKIGKKYAETKDSYEALDNEWKLMLGSSEFKEQKKVLDSMKYVEDRAKYEGYMPNNNGSNNSSYSAQRSSGNSQNNTPVESVQDRVNRVANVHDAPTPEEHSDAYDQWVRHFNDPAISAHLDAVERELNNKDNQNNH